MTDDTASRRGAAVTGGTPARPTPAHADPPLNPTPGFWDHYENVYAERADGDEGTCLRPLGRCEMGGCCELCWHNPDHPRFAGRAKEAT